MPLAERAKIYPKGFVVGCIVRASKIQQRIRDYLASRTGENAFLRPEFDGCGETRSGVDKAIRALVRQGVLVRGGYGVLVRARHSPLTGKIVPSVPADLFVPEALRKLRVPIKPDSATRAYNEDRSTQIPAWLAFEVGNSRISRKMGFGRRMVNYERNGKWVPLIERKDR
jgi:hypothetical protein